MLSARVYELRRREAEEERSQDRKQQIGSLDRSERIRTYNFPQVGQAAHKIHGGWLGWPAMGWFTNNSVILPRDVYGCVKFG